MKTFFLFTIIHYSLLIVTCYPQVFTWQRLYPGQSGWRAIQTNDGMYVILIHKYVGLYDKIQLIKVSQFGDSIWTRIIGGNDRDAGYWIEETSDHGFIIGGATTSFGVGNISIYLVKTDSIGQVQWQKVFTMMGALQQCWNVKQTSDSDYVLACRTNIYGINKISILKANKYGDSVWQKIYGGNTNEYINEIIETNNYGYLAVGTMERGYQLAELYMLRLNKDGDTVWTKIFGGTNISVGLSVTKTFDGGFIMGGYSNSFNAYQKEESYIVKTDSLGNLQWQRTYSSLGLEECYSIRKRLNGGYILTGTSDSANVLIESAKIRLIDDYGNMIFETSYSPGQQTNGFRTVESTVDGGYILAGYAEITGGTPFAYLVKTDSIGFANPIGIKKDFNKIPQTINLFQNYPNPFNPTTKIKFEIPTPLRPHFNQRGDGAAGGFVVLTIYDILGREVATLVNEQLKPGSYEVQWNGSNYASGLYFYRLQAGDPSTGSGQGYAEVKKMVLLK